MRVGISEHSIVLLSSQMCLSELFSLLNDAPLTAEFFLIECDLLSETELSAHPELFTAQDEAPENQATLGLMVF